MYSKRLTEVYNQDARTTKNKSKFCVNGNYLDFRVWRLLDCKKLCGSRALSFYLRKFELQSLQPFEEEVWRGSGAGFLTRFGRHRSRRSSHRTRFGT